MRPDSSVEQELEQCRTAWDAMRDEVRTKYAGQYVAIAGGRIVASGPDAESVQRSVDVLEPAFDFVEIFAADAEPILDVFEDSGPGFLEAIEETEGSADPSLPTTGGDGSAAHSVEERLEIRP